MTGRGQTFKERLRARRERVKETSSLLSDGSDVDLTTRPQAADDTWNAAMEDDNVQSIDNLQATSEEEEKQSEHLVKTLQKKRKKTEKELSRALESQTLGDVSEQLMSAKKRTRERIEARRQEEEEEEELADTVESTDAEIMSLGRPPTGRSAVASPSSLDDSQTPRRMSTALSLSLRARLGEKIRAAKDKGKDEAYDESKPVGRRLAGKRHTGRVTRFDDPSLIREDLDDETYVKSQLARNRWKEATKTSVSEPTLTPEMQYNFFTLTFDAVEEDKETEKEETELKQAEREEGAGSPAEEGREEGDVEEGRVQAQREEEPTEEEAPTEPKQNDVPEERQLLIDDIAEIANQWLAFEMVGAEYKPFRDRIRAEKEVYFTPSMRQPPITAKISEDKAPRNLEEEGIYVGERPPVPRRNINKMENRLLGETNKSLQWFGESGDLIALPDPVKEISSRPVMLEEIDPAITADYVRAVVSDFDMHFIDSATDGRGRFQLDVDINTLVFQHHHLFSREHVLATQITQQYQHYMWRSQKQLVKFLRQKLTAVKRAEKHVQDSLARITKEQKGGSNELEFRLREYQDEIKLTRHTLEAEMRADRILLKNIIKTWKEIKNLRETDKCINTSVKLIIKKEPTNKVADLAEWERDVEEEVEEVKREVDEEHKASMAVYRSKMETWKAQRTRKKEARKRQKQRAKRPETETETNQDIEEAKKDLAILDEFEAPKPEKPKQVTAADLRERILQKYDEIRRKPGEPLLYPELSNGASITATKQCPSKEQQRRADVNRYKVYVRITFNNKDISRTPARLLGQDFTVHFAQIFNVEIVQWPESIKIEIYETAGLTSTLLTEVYAPIPDVNMTGENVLLNELEFSSSQKIAHSHAGVGSDVQMNLAVCEEDQQVSTLFTSGILTTSVSWAVNSEGKVLVPPVAPRGDQLQGAMAAVDIISALGMAGMTDMDKLIKWISQARLDPNDPSNADLMYLLRPVGGGDGVVTSLQLPEHYRLDQLQAEFDFVTDQYIESSRRFRLIQYREREIPDFKNKVIPAFDWEISEDVFTAYEKKLAGEDRKKMDELDSHRVAVSLFVQKMREDILLRLRLATHHKVLSDMVYEEAVPNIATLIPSMMKLFEPRRPLKPIRKKRKKVTPQSQEAIKILVNIVHAYNIPVRTEALPTVGAGIQPASQHMSFRAPPATTTNYPREYMSPQRSPIRRVHYYQRYWQSSEMFLQMLASMWDCVMRGFTCLNEAFSQMLTAPLIAFQVNEALILQNDYAMYNTILGIPLPKPDIPKAIHTDPNPVLVRPFVEVVFQKTSQQTSVGDGPNPTWNEELQLPFKARNDDYSTTNLQTMRDAVYFNLFDECVVDMVQDERERMTSIHRRIEKRWLGSITIPFSTIYANSRVDGTFRVTSPPILLGYTRNVPDNLGMMTEMDVDKGNFTYLSMFITIEPPLTPPEPFKERFDSSEDEKLLSYAATWQTALEKKFTSRNFTTTVVDISGKSVFVTRYFRSLRPPEELLKDTNDPVATAELVARFVSLVPFMSDSIIFAGLFDIWGTCDQFLRMLQGDEDEHAVLLVNYFLHLEKKAWLLLGTAIPEGRTAYVITQEGEDFWIWNASTGEHFRKGDSHCPVTAIHCLVNAENIWANIQPHCQPCRMQFDLKNTKNWKPFFCSAFPDPGLSSVQPAQLLYYPTDQSYVLNHQDMIETTLKHKVMEWRPRSITRWNRYCMKTFRTLLVGLEEARGHGLQQKHCDELEKVLGAYKMTGFPINMPHSEMDLIVEAVYATGVHNTENRDVEFALAVHVHPYPNSVLSIWIYIASLVKKR